MNRTLTLVKTAYEPGQIEVFEAPQIALAGRSNVGKSSLINSLAGRKSLAKISSTPGKTRSINYYLVQPGGYYLVDLPGYGYAKTSKTERAKWGSLIEGYLRKNPWLAGVGVLIDSRIPPQRLDLDMTGFLAHTGIPMLPVLTKCDKTKQRDRAALQKQWQELLHLRFQPLCCSSKTGSGMQRLWEQLDAMAEVMQSPEPLPTADAGAGITGAEQTAAHDELPTPDAE